jgi:RecB family endonuclease NucS
MFKRLDLDQERELESQVIKDPEALEDGLVYLTHQRAANDNYIDVLAADSDGVLVVIELKVGEEDEMHLNTTTTFPATATGLPGNTRPRLRS